MAVTLDKLAHLPVTELKGVGPERAEALLDGFGITSVLDLVTHYPRRYLDQTRMATIGELRVGDRAWVFGQVVSTHVVPRRGKIKPRLEVRISDGSGQMKVTFFNQPWRQKQFAVGMEALFFGKVDTFKGAKSMANRRSTSWVSPSSASGRCTRNPTSNASTRRTCGLDRQRAQSRHRFRRSRARVGARSFRPRQSNRRVQRHPPSVVDGRGERRSPRLVFDELLRIQLALVLRKRALERRSAGIAHQIGGELVRRFHAQLPYTLTSAQERVIDEIERDLASVHPMHRLLQGDVGSGKTVVAVSALLVAVQGGMQGALMAADGGAGRATRDQRARLARGVHHVGENNLFSERPLQVDLLTGRTPAAERRKLHARLEAGETDILIGTHALIEEGIAFKSLGAVVVDEQHRFGVEQRAALREKGAGDLVPDVLVMTATPIPRTAAMTVYGDLDVSTLDEMPPGREKITTVWEKVEPGELTLGELTVWAHVREEVAAGRQAYVVCPLIEESEKLDVRSAEATYEELSTGELAGLRLALLHGRLTSAEKERVMTQFRNGAVDVLVSTTVIEVVSTCRTPRSW